MSERDKIVISLNACFILLFSFLFLGQCSNERRIKQMDQRQSEINRAAYEKNERMDQELRLLTQDVKIHNSILLSQEFITEDEE